VTGAISPARPVRRHDVVVLASAGAGHRIVRELRHSRLRVGAWLLPPAASPASARTRLRRDLARPQTLTCWQWAPLIVTLWDSPQTGALVETAVHATLRVRIGPAPRWLQLSPHTADPGPAPALHAPLLISDERIYLPETTRIRLRDELAAPAAATTVYYRVLHTLLDAVPPVPRWLTYLALTDTHRTDFCHD
jgi:hypothetical protein